MTANDKHNEDRLLALLEEQRTDLQYLEDLQRAADERSEVTDLAAAHQRYVVVQQLSKVQADLGQRARCIEELTAGTTPFGPGV